MIGSELIAQALADQGVPYFFNLPGNGVYPLLDPIAGRGITYLLGLHEFSLIAMADGYARATGRPSFVNVYMAPGTANGLAATYVAYRDRSPLVITATQQQTSMLGRDSYAAAPDLLAMVRQYTKWAFEVPSVERFPEAIHRAFQIAATHPRGPVFLSLPVDLFREEPRRPLTEPSRPVAVPGLGAPSPAFVQDVARRLANARMPLFVCGYGVLACEAVGRVERLAQALGAAVTSDPWMGMVAFPNHHQLGFGEYKPALLEQLQPDLVLVVGARWTTEAIGPTAALPEGVETVWLGLDAQDSGRVSPLAAAGVGDVGLGLEAILRACDGQVDAGARNERLARIAGLQADRVQRREAARTERFDQRPISLPRLFQELNGAIDADTVIIEHATTAEQAMLEDLTMANPMNVFSTGGSTQGWGMPASIGSQLGRPNQRVLAVVGDGGFTFAPQGLWTAAKHNIPVTVVVLNNQGYLSSRGSVQRMAPQSAAAGVDFGFDWQVDVASVARGFGVLATRVEDPADLTHTVRAALRHDGPDVVEVLIGRDATLPL